MLTKSHIKHLNDLRQKKAVRDEYGMFIAEGPKVVEELLHIENIEADEVFATDEWLFPRHELVKERSRFFMEVRPHELERISGLKTPNQVFAVFYKPDFAGHPNLRGNLSILLDEIQDPGNLGTIIRIADWFGIQNIICSQTCADAFAPKVVQSTMGSLGRVRVEYADLNSIISQNPDLPVYAAALDGTSIYNQAAVTEGFLLIGNEARGVSSGLLEKSFRKITIPRIGQAESLNAAVATGIILSHICGSR